MNGIFGVNVRKREPSGCVDIHRMQRSIFLIGDVLYLGHEGSHALGKPPSVV